MRNAILASFLTGVILVGAAAVQAGPPVSGTWKSTNLDFDEGTGTKAGSNFLAAGNALYGRSYAGGVFTNDWTVECPIIASAVALGPPIGNNGNYSYMITYQGGYVTLGGPGNPWNGGDAVYTGVISTFVEFRTIQVVGGLVTGWVSDYNVEAQLQGYSGTCVTWAIGNGALRGGTSPQAPKAFNYTVLQSVKGVGYPDYPGAGCVLGPNGPGTWEDIRDLTLTIGPGCTVATEKSSWGSVKAMYRD